MNSKHFGYGTKHYDYLGQKKFLLAGLFCPVSNNIVKTILNYHFILRYIPEYRKLEKERKTQVSSF